MAFNQNKPCALLIGNDDKDGLIIRFLVANVLDQDAKGSGSFLVQKMLELAQKTDALVLTRPENSEKYWQNKMGFQPAPKDPTLLIHVPVPQRESKRKVIPGRHG